MSHQWFLYSNEVVTGPFSTDDVHAKLASGQLEATCFIWWKGQREWIPVQTWQETLTQILATASGNKQKAVWYVDVGSAPIGPLTQAEMIENLKGIAELGRVKLWAVGMPKWKSLFELHDVMELLGISRREHERAPLMGTVAVTRSNEDPRGFVAKAASISVAGLGLSAAQDLRRGDEVALLIKSSGIPGNLHLRGEVVYVTDAGHAGIRFLKVHPESHTLIHDYVKRFAVEDMSGRSAA
jgi:hypothetical protein